MWKGSLKNVPPHLVTGRRKASHCREIGTRCEHCGAPTMTTRLSRCFVGAAAAATAAAGGNTRKSDSGSSKGSNRHRQNGLRREHHIDTFVNRSSGTTNSLLCARGFSGAATGSPEAERSPSSWRDLFGSTALLTRVAHADALAVGEEMKEGTVISQLGEGEKPELIQRADEQV